VVDAEKHTYVHLVMTETETGLQSKEFREDSMFIGLISGISTVMQSL